MRDEISKILRDIEYAEVKEALEVFSAEGRPFALPSFKQQDRTSTKQRVADLLGGFPYTNETYPWPVGGPDNLHMQPIIQISLEKAGKLLNFDFGNGLLQLWGIVGECEKSFDSIQLAFDSDKTKGIFSRIIPAEEIKEKPSVFFPEFAPWLREISPESDRSGHLFIEPTQQMSLGSTIAWRISKCFMYPKPCYDFHEVAKLVPNPSAISEGVDSMELFDEFRAAVNTFLKSPHDGGGCYLGGVRGYDTGRYADPAQGYPILLALGGDINISVIFDDSIFVKPGRTSSESAIQIQFPREKKLRVVYSYSE